MASRPSTSIRSTRAPRSPLVTWGSPFVIAPRNDPAVSATRLSGGASGARLSSLCRRSRDAGGYARQPLANIRVSYTRGPDRLGMMLAVRRVQRRAHAWAVMVGRKSLAAPCSCGATDWEVVRRPLGHRFLQWSEKGRPFPTRESARCRRCGARGSTAGSSLCIPRRSSGSTAEGAPPRCRRQTASAPSRPRRAGRATAARSARGRRRARATGDRATWHRPARCRAR